MMTYEMFKEVFASEFKNYLPDELKHLEVNISSVQKVNKTQDSLSMVDPDMGTYKMGPSISVSEFYDDYLMLGDLNEVLTCAANIMVEGYQDMPQVISELDFSTAKDNIVFELINTKKNEELLKGIPHREMEDLSVIYRWMIDVEEDAFSGAIVNDSLANRLGLNEEELFALATQNTSQRLPVTCRSMREVLAGLMIDDGMPMEMLDVMFEDHPVKEMYVISNEMGLHGAASILYDEPLQEVAQLLGEDLYILPSSIHEIIVVPCSMGEPEHLSEMVKDINAGVVRAEEVLSDNVYVYDKNTRSISMVTGRESLLDQLMDAQKELDASPDKIHQVQKDLGLTH